jgi:outer membrane immunogenic protein
MTSKLIKAAAAALSLLGFSLAAQAADMPIKAPYYKGPPSSVIAYYNWTGFYAGINGGYGFGTSDWDVPSISNKPKGGLIGGTVGYNWQSGAIVYGLEGDFDWADVKESVTCGALSRETKNDWLATVRGRLGYAFDRWPPYITGGGAFGNVKATSTNPAAGGASNTQVGWTVGAGLEYAFLGNWSAKIEYLYVDLGSFHCGVTCAGAVVTDKVSLKENVVRAGLNYKFSGPIFTRY